MDVQDWKRLSRSDKKKMWDTLTQGEKQAILAARNKGGKKSRAPRKGNSSWARGRGVNRSHFSSTLLRGIAIGAAVLAPVLLLLSVSDRGAPGYAWLIPTLVVVLIAIVSYSMTLCIEILEGILEESRELTAHISRMTRGNREPDQESQKASSNSATN